MADRYTDPYMAEIASNIGKAFSADTMGKSVVQRAQAEHLRLQTDKLTRERDARLRGGNLLRQNASPTELAANGYEGDIPIAQTSGTTLYMRANDPNASTEEKAGAYLGAGHAIGKDSAFSAADRELVAARDARDAKARSDSSAGIGAGATIAVGRMAEDGRMARRFDAPHNTAEGAAVNFNPADPRFAGGPVSGSVLAPKPLPADHLVKIADPNNPSNISGLFATTKDAVGKPVAPGHVGADKTVIVEGPDGKPVYAQASTAVANGMPAATARAPATPDTKESEANAIVYSALQSIGATSVNGSTVEIAPDFLAMYGDKLPAAKEAAVLARQKSKNPGAAEAAFLTALGVEPGRMFKPKGTPLIGSGPAAMVPRPGAAAPAAAPAVTADPLEGRTATDGNGNKIMRQHGQWVPVK